MYDPYNNFDRREETQQPIHTTYHMVGDVEQPVKKKRSGVKIAALCLCCALLGGIAGAGGAALAGRIGDKGETTIYHGEHTPVAVTVANVPSSTVLTPAQVYAANVDACVGITVSTTTTNVFGYTTTAAATGSGFVITRDGYIVTNYHVVEEGVKDKNVPITVSFQNGESYQAKLVGGEADNDVAVLKIEAQNLTPVVMGDSDKLVVGEAVYAIGNPLGELTYSLTDGLVSALDRVITTGSGNNATSLNMLQTNCAINPGNSGGPLFNAYGEVVGITTAKMSGSGSSASVEGLGFAVPVNDIKNIVKDLIEHGYVTGKPYMGVHISSVSELDAKRYGLKVGAYVDVVEENSSAEKAGLKVGDIIIAIDDTEINTHSALIATVATYRAGDTVTLKILRDQKEMELKLTLAEKQPEAEQPETQQSQSGQQPSGGGQNGGNGRYYYQWPFSDFGSLFGFPF